MKRGSNVPPVLCLLAALAGGCSDSGDAPPSEPPYGLESRQIVQGINFPNSLPQPSALQIVRAFPALTFAAPVFLAAPPDGTDRIFVVELGGRIRLFQNDPAASSAATFLDIGGKVVTGGERGLLGFAFHPDYATNGWFYVYYSAPPIGGGDHRSVVARYQVSAGDPSVADPASEQILLQFAEPFSNHNAGCLAFGPDGKLYVAVGDGGSGDDPQNNAQNLGNLLGKILRLEPDGSVPADNPFVGVAGVRGEIWAFGLRNPWRFSFDRTTGTLWAGDVGQNAREEIDIVRRGENYGWRVYEGELSNINPGSLPPTAFTLPVIAYAHSLGFSVTGGNVYRGPSVTSLVGAYVYGDYGSGRVWALVHDGVQVLSNDQIGTVSQVVSFGEDAAGELYLVSLDGRLFRFEETAGTGQVPPVLSATGLFANTAALVPAPGLVEYDVNAPLWSDGARKRRWIALPGVSRILYDSDDSWTFPVGTILVKHFELDLAPGVVQRLETRVLVRHDAEWRGYTYRWNPAQTDANLIDEAESATYTVADPAAPGGQRDQTWTFPSRADCLTCHTVAAGRVLGVRTRQLNRDFAYPLLVDNQLRSWNHIGMFDRDIGPAAAQPRQPDPADASASVASRARSYLDANCSFCHRPGGPTPVAMDLLFPTPIGATETVGVTTVNPADGAPGTVRIEAGAKESSELWNRLGRLDQYRMPPLASSLVDEAARTLIGDWIDAGAE